MDGLPAELQREVFLNAVVELLAGVQFRVEVGRPRGSELIGGQEIKRAHAEVMTARKNVSAYGCCV